MAILLKNLTARTPDTRDFAALAGLVRACEEAENRAGGELAGQLSAWRRMDSTWPMMPGSLSQIKANWWALPVSGTKNTRG